MRTLFLKNVVSSSVNPPRTVGLIANKKQSIQYRLRLFLLSRLGVLTLEFLISMFISKVIKAFQ